MTEIDKKEETKQKNFKKQQKRVKNEIVLLRSKFNDIEENKLKAVSSIIENVAFMNVTLQDLQDDINLNGAIEKYKNGDKQWGLKANPAIQAYNTMIKNYSSLMKQLTDLLPGNDADDDDGFDDDYVNG